MKIHTKDLTKRNWEALIAFNIVDAEGNGFARTSKEFDSLIRVSRFPKYIQVKNTMYEVAFYSGCFYPLWSVVTSISNPKPYEYYRMTVENGTLKATEKVMGGKDNNQLS